MHTRFIFHIFALSHFVTFSPSHFHTFALTHFRTFALSHTNTICSIFTFFFIHLHRKVPHKYVFVKPTTEAHHPDREGIVVVQGYKIPAWVPSGVHVTLLGAPA